MKMPYILGLTLLLATQANAQLDTISSFNQVINDIRTFDGKLFIAGGFTQNEGSTCYWSAYLNNGAITRHTNLIGGSGIRELEVFDGDLYHVGTLDFGGAIGVGVWNGSGWNDAGSTNYSHSTIYSNQTKLYVESDNGLIRSKTAGGSWQTLHDFAGSGGISAIRDYGSNVIFGGSFSTISGVSANNIASWNGTSWTALGTGLDGSVSFMTEYNGNLYVAGDFTNAGGVAVDGIAMWNGTSWSDVDGGLAGASFGAGINEMIVFNSKLYVVGRFNLIGGQTADDFAYWDGSSWIGINYAHPEVSFTCVEEYNNELYLGSFDFSKSRLYRYEGGVGIAEQDKSYFTIAPNPSNGYYEIQTDKVGKLSFEVYDQLGKKVSEGLGTYVDITHLINGIYYLSVDMNGDKSTVLIEKI